MTQASVVTDKEIRNIKRQFNRIVRRARAAEFIERAVPKAVAPLLVSAAFLTTSWLGAWNVLPAAGRIAAALGFSAAFAASPFMVKGKSLRVTREDALKRIDAQLDNPADRPAMILGDKLSSKATDIEKHLWNIRLKTTWDRYAGELKAGMPKPNVSLLKPFKLAVIGATLASGLFATDDHLGDINKVMDWKSDIVMTDESAIIQGLQLKAFITPPDGIAIEPLYLDQDTKDHEHGGEYLTAHEQSTMTLLISDTEADIKLNGESLAYTRTMTTGSIKNPKTTYVYEFDIGKDDFKIDIAGGPSWSFKVHSDSAPALDIITVNVGDNEEGNTIGIDYYIKDDIGVEGGTVTLTPADPKDPDAVPLPSSRFNPIKINPN